ncbi:hypothetical protein B484DRAFT_444171 [Ochromonadaceae sp. CCMP2298]|nr:hypothetical protein B484DRAFT_444171 [Ochromonadaceae sp. CCMP2298]
MLCRSVVRTAAPAALLALAVVFIIVRSLCTWMLMDNPAGFDDLLINTCWRSPYAGSSEMPHSALGLDTMKTSNITIIGLGKGLRLDLRTILFQLEDLSSRFSYSRAILVLDQIDPAQRRRLLNWAEQSSHNRTLLLDTQKSIAYHALRPNQQLPREATLAAARNAALTAFRALPPTEYVISFDMDIIGYDMHGVEDSFGQSRSWDVACSHGVVLYGVYRDAYAFRTAGVSTNHHLSGSDHQFFDISDEQAAANKVSYLRTKKKLHRMMERSTGVTGATGGTGGGQGKLLKVDSCFGGLAIYKAKAMEGCWYNWHSESPYVVDCEHVFMHQCLAAKNNATIVTNNNMKLWYGHTDIQTLNWTRAIGSVTERYGRVG